MSAIFPLNYEIIIHFQFYIKSADKWYIRASPSLSIMRLYLNHFNDFVFFHHFSRLKNWKIQTTAETTNLFMSKPKIKSSFVASGCSQKNIFSLLFGVSLSSFSPQHPKIPKKCVWFRVSCHERLDYQNLWWSGSDFSNYENL